MYPGKAGPRDNQFINLMVQALRSESARVREWNHYYSARRPDIFHVHWPERIPFVRQRPYEQLRGDIMAANFFRTIDRVRRSGGKLVWTVHNLKPHDRRLRNDAFYQAFMDRFVPCVDLCISLTEAGIGPILAAYPALECAPFRVVRHPHYRSVLRKEPRDPQLRAALGIRKDQVVFSMLGSLRASKQPLRVAQEFVRLEHDRFHLLLAGNTDPSTAESLRATLGGRTNCTLELRTLSETELLARYALTDICVFAATDYFNSGSIYTSLSLDVPVLAADTPVNRELRQIVGTEWLHLCSAELSSPVFEQAERELVRPSPADRCDLSAFDPSYCAREQVSAYWDALESASVVSP
jgi:beta-1,4-mannosyltransferase